IFFFFFSSRRRHTRSKRDWSSDVCSSDLCLLFALVIIAFVIGIFFFGFAGILNLFGVSIDSYLSLLLFVIAYFILGTFLDLFSRSEERRVGKECISRWELCR